MAAADVLELRVYQIVLTGGTRRVAYFARYQDDQPDDDVIKISVPISNELTDAGSLRFTPYRGTDLSGRSADDGQPRGGRLRLRHLGRTNGDLNRLGNRQLRHLYSADDPAANHCAGVAWKDFATVAGNVDVGIYSEAGTRLVNSGSTAQAGTSTIQKVGIADTAIGPGTYYFALTNSTTTATFSGSTASSQLAPASYCQAETTGAFGLPATATFSPIASNRYAFIAAFYVSTAA
jgi:hypothetical protein